MEKNISPDAGKMYNQEFNDVQGKWNKVKAKVSNDLHLLEEIIPKLRAFEVNLEAIGSLLLLQGKIVVIMSDANIYYLNILHSFYCPIYYVLKLRFITCLPKRMFTVLESTKVRKNYLK